MNAEFLKSASRPADFPPDRGREVAVVGRSNSGKSSAVNAILGRGKLARVSKTPGRTRLVNFFAIGDNRRLVDLPGYGYARVAAPVRDSWNELITAYFESRHSVSGLIITIDIRRGLMPLDQEMIDWARHLGIPVMLLATKADKLSRNAARTALRSIERAVTDTGAAVLLFSSPRRLGVDAARAQLEAWLDGADRVSGN